MLAAKFLIFILAGLARLKRPGAPPVIQSAIRTVFLEPVQQAITWCHARK